MSLVIERATPGYWLFSARSRPSGVVARCTCPIEAAAMGSQSNVANHRSPSAAAPTASSPATRPMRANRPRRVWGIGAGDGFRIVERLVVLMSAADCTRCTGSQCRAPPVTFDSARPEAVGHGRPNQSLNLIEAAVQPVATRRLNLLRLDAYNRGQGSPPPGVRHCGRPPVASGSTRERLVAGTPAGPLPPAIDLRPARPDLKCAGSCG